MKFIKKKNLQEGEELLYVPRLHWFFTIKHLALALPFFLILLVLWKLTETHPGLEMAYEFTAEYDIEYTLRNLFLATVLVVLLVFVWRIFQYLCTEYGVTNKRLIIKKGVFRIVVAEIPIDRIESIYCIKGILGRIFNYGTIRVSGIGGMTSIFHMVDRPFALRRRIVDVIEKNKTITVVHGELPRVKPVIKPSIAIKDEPIYRYGTFVRILGN